MKTNNSSEAGFLRLVLLLGVFMIWCFCKEMMSLKSDAETLAWAVKNHERLFPKRDVSGLVRFGLEMKDEERSKLMKLQENADRDFILLNDGSKPNLISGLGYSGAGVLILLGAIAFLRKGRDASPAEI